MVIKLVKLWQGKVVSKKINIVLCILNVIVTAMSVVILRILNYLSLQTEIFTALLKHCCKHESCFFLLWITGCSAHMFQETRP